MAGTIANNSSRVVRLANVKHKEENFVYVNLEI